MADPDFVRRASDQPGPVYSTVPAEKQREALQFITDQLFLTPTWVQDEAILVRVGPDVFEDIAGDDVSEASDLHDTAATIPKEAPVTPAPAPAAGCRPSAPSPRRSHPRRARGHDPREKTAPLAAGCTRRQYLRRYR